MDKKKKPSKGKKKPSKPRKTKGKPVEPLIPSGATTTFSDAKSYTFSSEFDETASPDPMAFASATGSVQFTIHPVPPALEEDSLPKKVGRSLLGLLKRLRLFCNRGGEEEHSV